MYEKRYREFRERDVNLFVGISDKKGKLTLFGKGTAASMSSELNSASDSITVPVITMNDVFNNYVPDGQVVHFLKIDVEGYEENVIRGMDWTKHRPWVLCIEALDETDNKDWDEIIKKSGYKYIFHDELNNWYVEEAHNEIIQKFSELDKLSDFYEIISLTDTYKWKDYENSTSWRITAPLRSVMSFIHRK